MCDIERHHTLVIMCFCWVFHSMNDNNLGTEGAKALVDDGAFRGSLTSINLASNSLGEEGAKALGPAIAVSHSLTAADLRYTNLDDQAKRVLRDCVKDRAGFDMKL